jgi:nitronate monooxygenase
MGWRSVLPPTGVVQAPIGGAVTPELVAAVGEAGGLGLLAASWTTPDQLRSAIERIRRLTDRPFGINLILEFDQRERVELCIEARVPVLSFFWGVDEELFRRARAGGATVLAQVGSLDEALAAEHAGAEALVVQGVEAGGHVRGTTPLLTLLRAVRQRTSLPLVAAGGIGDPAGGERARAAGADAIALGTRFLASDESAAGERYARALIDGSAADTRLLTLFDGGWPDAPHRVLVNSTVRAWEEAGRPPSGSRPGEDDVVAHIGEIPVQRYSVAHPFAGVVGDLEALALYAGMSVDAIDDVLPAADIVERFAARR